MKTWVRVSIWILLQDYSGRDENFPLSGTHINRNSRYGWSLSACQGQVHATPRAGPEKPVISVSLRPAEELCFQHRCLHVFILLLSLLFPSPIKDERNKQGFFFFFRKLGKDQALWKRKIRSQRFRKVKKNTNELKKEEYRSRTENKSQHFSNLVKKMCFAVKHMPFPKMTANHVCLGILWLAFLGKEQKSQGSTPGIPLREVGGKPKSLSGNNWSSSLFRKGGLMHFSLKCKMKNKILKMQNKFIF